MKTNSKNNRVALLILAVVNALCLGMTNSLIPPTTRKHAANTWRRSSSSTHNSSNGSEEDYLINPLQLSSAKNLDTSNSSIESLSSLIGGETDDTSAKKKRMIMGLALFSTYFAVMGAKCALPSTFNQLASQNSGLETTHNPQKIISKMLFCSTAAVSAGKFLLGPIIDKVGGVTCLKVALSMLLVTLATIASTTKFVVFAVSWVCVDFIFSSCWAACLSAIHRYVLFIKSNKIHIVTRISCISKNHFALQFLIFFIICTHPQHF